MKRKRTGRIRKLISIYGTDGKQVEEIRKTCQ